jgi:hypothetical protein
MKARLLYITNGAEAIGRWGQFSVSPRFGFTLARVSKVIEPIIADFEKERLKLLEKYAEGKSDGNYAFPDNATRAVFNRELSELLATEIELAGISQISLKTLEDEMGKNDKFAPTLAELISISWLFDEET